jgi:hypothetical protein
MKNHWRQEHGWSVPRPRDIHGYEAIQAAEQAIRVSSQPIACQRIFARGVGSHYIHVLNPGPSGQADELPQPNPDLASQLVQEMEANYQHLQQAQDNVIQAGHLDEANPWLRRTQWVQYLQDIDIHHLLASVAQPDVDSQGPTPGQGSEAECAARMIWEAVEGVARVSQRVASQTGHLIRVEAVRTEKQQNPYQPLQAYMNEENIVRHVEPWQQILMFFARTHAGPA